jgi:hypothetical protein
MNAHLAALEARIAPLTAQLAHHPLYRSFESLDDLRAFMESHVFAVWDFMCLLKTLQRGLTCVQVPWLPSPLAESRRLINEIVFGEESDLYEGQPLSHFELYRLAMQQCGADTLPIDRFLAAIVQGRDWPRALAAANAPAPAARFVEATFRIIETGKLHAIAAAFTFGRDQDEMLGGQLSTLRWYMERHIAVDGDEHGPLALRMVAELCGDDPAKWREATEAATFALTARTALWDGIAAAITQNRVGTLA